MFGTCCVDCKGIKLEVEGVCFSESRTARSSYSEALHVEQVPWAMATGRTVPYGRGTQHTQARFQAEHDQNAVGRTFTELCHLNSGSLDQTSQLDAGHE